MEMKLFLEVNICKSIICLRLCSNKLGIKGSDNILKTIQKNTISRRTKRGIDCQLQFLYDLQKCFHLIHFTIRFVGASEGNKL